MWTGVIYLAVAVVAAEAGGPEKQFALSPLQHELLQAHNKWVVPNKERVSEKRHYFRLKTLSFDKRENVQKQIEAYEKRNRLGYDDGPFYVHDETGKEGKDSGWEKWYREVFVVEQDWAEGLRLPYFCEVLNLVDAHGKAVSFEDLSGGDKLDLSKAALKKILQPLSAGSKHPPRNTPIYIAQYRGNFEGNGKFVKLYIGKEDTADFLVFDVSVYDHY